jgi:competence protein ComEC
MGVLEVHFIDVGKGDSIFIRTAEGITALIDGGPGRSSALSYLQARGIERLDVVIATHPHEDHIGGLIPVLNTLSVGGIWTSGAAATTRTYERFLDTIESQHIPYHEVQTGQTISLGNLKLNVLYGVPNASNLNNTSLVLRLDYGLTSFLFMGDAEKPVERFLLTNSASLLPSTILKIGHHGSKTSSLPDFVQAVFPKMAIYTAGKDNRGDHPAAVTLKTFAELGIPVYGTDRFGTIVIFSNGVKSDLFSTNGPLPLQVQGDNSNPLPFRMTPIHITPSAPIESETEYDCSLDETDCESVP